MKTLNSKITFFGIAICIVTGLIVSIFSFYKSRNYLVSSKLRESENRIDLFTKNVLSNINEAKNDVLFLSSTPPVKEIFKALENHKKDSKNKDSVKTQLDHLEEIFREMLYAKNHYAQIRLVGTQHHGKEILRVERQGIRIFRVGEDDLQEKAEEPYFKEIMDVDPYKVYLSDFSLNREFGKITYPLQMMIRTAVPIYQNRGRLLGFIIINVDYTPVFKGLRELTKNTNSEYFIVNNKNKILLSSRTEFDLLDGHGIESTLPDSPKSIQDILKTIEKDGKDQPRDSYQNRLFLGDDIHVFKKIRYNELNPDEFLAFFLKIDKNALGNEIKADLINNFFLLLFLISIAIFISLYFSKKLASPLQNLMRLTQKISAGENVDLDESHLDSKDEIGTLAHTLLKMSKDIFKKNVLLESQKQALDSSAIVVETDLRGKITYVNDKFVEISKYRREELIGKDHRILNSGFHSKDFFADLWKTISKGDVWHEEIKNKAKDGTYYWVDTTIYPVKDEYGQLQKYIAIRFDITERKHIEEELRLISEETQKAMDIKSNFLANMSHEIRTPLNSVIGLTDVLEETPLTTDQKKYIRSLKNSGDSLLQIVNDILDLSKIEAGQLDLESIEFDLEDNAEEIIEMVSVKVQEKDVELILDFDLHIPKLVYGDSLRLKQILTNLLSNAIKFTQQGYVSLEARLLNQDNDNHTVNIEYRVTDTGVGISEESSQKIFESFTQADSSITRQFGGTGLGLNIVKQLVEKMNGTVSLESELGKGSTFIVRLPYRYNPTCLIKKSSIEHLVKDKKVLIVDNFLKTRNAISRIFEFWGAKIDHAQSGTTALQKIQSQDTYDLIILDCYMSDLSGEEVIQKLKEKDLLNPSSIIVTTEGRCMEDLGVIKEYGVESFISKPIKKSDLSQVIKKITDVQTKGQVLFVDDEPKLLERIQDLILPMNIDVHIAQDAKEALSMLKDRQFDALITDYNLPGDNGVELIRKTRKTDPIIPVAILSGFIDKKMIQSAKPLGIYDFIEKPYNIDNFLVTVENMVLKGREMRARKEAESLTAKDDKPSLKILVADDSADNRNLMKVYFKDQKHSVDFVENGAEAVSALEKSQYDLILMDMQMPVMDGYQATQIIRDKESKNHQKATPIIALTANALSEEKEKTYKVGCTDYLTKPVKKKVLMKYIEDNYKKAG